MGDNADIRNIDLLVLCGGKGERLKGLSGDRPKPMVDINGRPFLDILLDHLVRSGISRIIFCTGYRGDVVKDYYTDNGRSLNISFSQEPFPLGTAGAVKNAQSLVKSGHFLVVNGDSFCPIDLNDFMAFYLRKKAEYAVCLTSATSGTDYGSVSLDSSKRIKSFNEKLEVSRGGLINAGIYILDRKIFGLIASGKKASLEYDVFPSLPENGFYGYETDKVLIDIGTPDRLEAAKKRLN